MAGSAFVVTQDQTGNVLAVSRGPGGWVWTLPGGKQEPGEQLIQTALRELGEETGLYAVSAPQLLLLSRNGKRAIFRIEKVGGTLRPSHEGDVAYMPWARLIERGGRWSKLFAALSRR